jgi:hypothetical protein
MKITFLNLVILSLASFRLTRLIVFDKITEFIREPFFDEMEEVNEEGEKELYYIPKKEGVKKFFGELLSCYWCTGIWTTTGLVLLSYFIPYFQIVIMILAIAGLAAILETIVQQIIEK